MLHVVQQTIPSEVLQDIAQAGITAPSGDNCQPWRLQIRSTSILIQMDPSALGAFLDAADHATLISCGALIENLCLRGTEYGLESEVTRFETTAPDHHVAEVRFSNTRCAEDPLAGSVARRCTHRGLYERRPVHHHQLWSISEAAGVHGGRVHWFTRQEQGLVRRIATRADLLRYSIREARESFFKTLRWGKADDGLAINTLGVALPEALGFALLGIPAIGRLAAALGVFFGAVIRGCWLPMFCSGQIGALIVDKDTDWVTAGRAFQRLWIQSNHFSQLQLQPISPLSVFGTRVDELGGEGLTPKGVAMIQRGRAQIGELTQMEDDEKLMMLFRIGYANAPTRSRRKNLASFLG